MVATYYAWDPEFDCITKETDAAGAVNARYTQEPRLYGGLISQDRSGVSSYYHYDAVGSTRALTNSAQAMTDTAVYSAFGEQVASVGTTINPFGYVGSLGYYSDATRNSIYVRVRDYLSRLARWLSSDDRLFAQMVSQYAYCANSALQHVDPSGRDFIALAHFYIALVSNIPPRFLRYHYSLEKWVCCDGYTPPEIKVGEQIDFVRRSTGFFNFGAILEQIPTDLTTYCEMKSSVELGGFDWVVPANVRRDGSRDGDTSVVRLRLPLSVINIDRPDHGPIDAILPIFIADFETIRVKWEEVLGKARVYEWAEQEGAPPHLENWPRSLYYALGTNSRTFIFQMVKRTGLPWHEMEPEPAWRHHPGNDRPGPNPPSINHLPFFGYLWGEDSGNPGQPERA